MGDELPSGATTIATIADADAIDHAPHFPRLNSPTNQPDG
jgi:hypothetical protein